MNDGGHRDEHGAGGNGLPRCSICGTPSSDRYRPFCSKRCADIDLARWLGGRYAIAGGDSEADEDGPGRPAPPNAKETDDGDA